MMSPNEKSFTHDAFQSPEKSYSPIYAWVWNGPLSEEKINAQIEEMCRLGIRAFYIIPEPQNFRPTAMPTQLDPNYLTPAYFQYFRYATERAREYGMECWLYDEGGWPSGGACGRVLYEYPEYAKRNLRHYTRQYRQGEQYCRSGAAEAVFLDGCMIDDGYLFDADVEVSVYDSVASAWEGPGVPDYPDITVKEATQAFLRITHEQYKAHLGEHFGQTITAVFTDEPKAPYLPFRDELCRMYEEQYGESILPHVPVLLGKEPLNENNIEYKQRWYDLCSRVYCENFLMECKRWANANGMQFTGHLDRDDIPMGCIYGSHFHQMRGLRCMDLPGVDVIWRQIFPGEQKDVYIGGNLAGKTAENRFFPRYASSAAAQIGKDRAMTESFGVYGYGMTYEQMRFMLGFQAIRGVTVMNLMVVSYAREGYNMSQEAPGFSEIQACHCDLPIFNRYVERLSYVCSRGKRICDTALYYPVNDFWGGLHAGEVADEYELLGWRLEARGIDFDIVDDDVILQSKELRNGVISMGNAKYRKIIIPYNAYLTPSVKDALSVFQVNGGMVLSDADSLVPDICIRGGNEKIRVMHRVCDDNDLICLYNEAEERNTFSVNLNGHDGYFVDITSGCFRSINVSEDGYAIVTLESGESCALYLTEDVFPISRIIREDAVKTLDGPYTFRRVNQFVIGERYPEYYELKETPVPAQLGEWSSMTGRDFSGSGVYETEFTYTGGDAILDLGEVRHTCEVFLNGKSLGIRVMKPYRYEIPAELLLANNQLQIRVSNTPGNQHQYTKSFDKYQPWQLSVYKAAQDIFDRDSLDSGLWGPITIRCANHV